MIKQYQLQLKLKNEEPIPAFWAYRLYAWILSQVPADIAQQFHQEKKRSISQYLDHGIWTVNLLGKDAASVFSTVLEETKEIDLHTDHILVTERNQRTALNAEHFLQQGQRTTRKRTELIFSSPTSFKQAGRYSIFPTENLLIQSLLMRWNEFYPEFRLDDEDMLEAMRQGIHIVDYNLRSGRYHLKNTLIPCFYGKIYIEAKLPIVLQELWNSLLYFATYSGIGIKTTLGMGGVKLPSHEDKAIH